MDGFWTGVILGSLIGMSVLSWWLIYMDNKGKFIINKKKMDELRSKGVI